MDTKQAFEDMPVAKAVLVNAVPAVLSMLVTLIYNVADTFFIGQTGDEMQVAAVSLATPVFLLFMAIGTLYGIGGTSVISRAFGGCVKSKNQVFFDILYKKDFISLLC